MKSRQAAMALKVKIRDKDVAVFRISQRRVQKRRVPHEAKDQTLSDNGDDGLQRA